MRNFLDKVDGEHDICANLNNSFELILKRMPKDQLLGSNYLEKEIVKLNPEIENIKIKIEKKEDCFQYFLFTIEFKYKNNSYVNSFKYT